MILLTVLFGLKRCTHSTFKGFLYCIFSYLTDRWHFAEIDSKICNILCTNFAVPQGSTLRPVLFNLCVTDMKNILDGSECIQYTDDSKIYHNCKTKNINKCSNEIESELNAVEVWSKDTNLVFNPSNTFWKLCVCRGIKIVFFSKMCQPFPGNVQECWCT